MRRSEDRKMAGALVLAFAATLIAGCRDMPAENYVEVNGRLFVFNYRNAIATYLVTLAKLRPLPEGAEFDAAFENPAGGPPLTKRQTIWPALDKITVESPPIQCVVADRPYQVTIRILDGNGEELQRVETTLVSNTDQSVLPDRPLVVGPFYDPNPELAGHPDGKLPQGNDIACPAR
ncbi:hypothetical protein [Phyllobacterium phragmitis]